jgi:glutamate/tyrosine decarboxylase-like PLP-dependent enzyme
MDLDALQDLITQDRNQGYQPFCVVGTAGTVNVGSIDDLNGLANIAKAEGLWFHVDGAFGSTAMISDKIRPRLAGLSRADSLAFDFHKWLHVNYSAGCVLVRDGVSHRQSFADRAEYLRGADSGLAAGDYWPVDYGPELSRGFLSLKVWAQVKYYGAKKLARAIEMNCEQATQLGALVKAEPKLELLAPVALNIVCYRFVAEDADMNEINDAIVLAMHTSGIAVPSVTRLNGQVAIRVNLTNHRTESRDLELLVSETLRLGAELVENPRA